LSTFFHFLDLNHRDINMEPQNLNRQDIDDLLIRYLLDLSTDEENQWVKVWLDQHKENKRYFNQLMDLYYLGKVTKSPSGFDKEKSLDRIKAKYYQIKYADLKEKKKTVPVLRKNFKIAISIAASVLIAFGLGFYFHSVINHGNAVSTEAGIYNEVTSPKGSRTQIVLPDGTKVWLNANSRIKYPMDFLKGDREVSLTGEAFFEVTKNNKRRFIVKTGDLAIKVWGTKFNVKAYPEEKTIQTTLVEGSVSIRNLKEKYSQKETYLKPQQIATYYKTGTSIQYTPEKKEVTNKPIAKQEVIINDKVKTIIYTSWKDDKWIIEGETLGLLAVELERRYNVKIEFENATIKNYRFNGIFRDETFEQLLKIISLSAPINYTINNNNVLLKEDTNLRKSYDKFLKR
jgi:transmembrane sensor